MAKKPKRNLQHGKTGNSSKRPRGWHRGLAEGGRAITAVDRAEATFVAAARDRVELEVRAELTGEEERAEERLRRAQLARVAPTVLSLPDPLL